MSNKSLAVLAAAAIVAVLAAVAASFSTGRSDTVETPDLLFPELMDRVNDVAAVSIRQGALAVDLERTDGVWTIAQKAGYPAKPDTIKQLVLSLAEIEPLEPKTDNPELYHRIGLQDPAEDNIALGVTLADGAGATLAGAVLGSRPATVTSGARFVRTLGDDRCWLASATVVGEAEPMTWLDRELLRIPQARVEAVRVEHASGDAVGVIARGEIGAGRTYEIRDLPAGMREKDASAGRLAGAIGYVGLQDVIARPAPDAALEDRVTTTYTLTSGLALAFTTWLVEGQAWMTIDATAPNAPAPGATDEQGNPEFDLATDEAEQLASRLGAWAFAIDQPKAESLRVTLEAMTEPAPTEAPAGNSVTPVE